MLSAALLTDDKQVSPGLSVLKTYQSSAVRWVFARPLMLLFQHFKISQNIENIFVLACITTIDSLMLQVDWRDLRMLKKQQLLIPDKNRRQ